MAKELIPHPASRGILDKIETKHGVVWEEVEELFANHPRHFRLLKADQYGEARFYALGQTDAGRYLTIVYVPQESSRAKVISARDMDAAERRRFQKR